MECYERNRTVLQEHYSGLWEKIEKEERKDYKIEILDTRDGNHALVAEKEGKVYRLNSAYRPLEETKRWADQYEFQNIGVLVFMYGFGNGYFVRELLSRAAKDARVFLWEPNAVLFRTVLEYEDLTDIFADKRFSFYLGEEGLQEMKNAASSVLGWQNMSTQIRCSHICYDQLFEKEYHQFFDMLEYIIGMACVKRDTNAWFAHSAVDNVLRNIRYIRHSNFITELIGRIPEDIPAVVVAAGPSLEKNIDLLKKAYGKAFIIATDTAVMLLESKGLPYDCIVTVDPRKPAWYLTEYPGCKDKVLFCEAQGQPDLMEFHTGRKVWNSGSVYLESLYNQFGLFFPAYDTGGSVATAGVAMAQQLGLKTVILIGQDLAYEGDKTHAGGFENHIRNEEKSISYVEGIGGEPVKTRQDWRIYQKWLEDFTKEYGGIELIDATEGGALIHGSVVMTFCEAIDKYCDGKEFSFDQCMKELPETFEVLDFKPVWEKILKLEKGMQNIAKKAREGKKEAEEFLSLGRRISAKKHDRILKEIQKANNFIGKQPGYELVETFTCDLTLGDMRMINQVTGDAYTDERNSVKIALSLYDSFIDAVEIMGERLTETLQEL